MDADGQSRAPDGGKDGAVQAERKGRKVDVRRKRWRE